jgi:putative FmdB family regulatory protein
MPIYEYDCKACGARFDRLVFLSSQPKPILCPECSSGQVSKRLSLIAASSGGSTAGASSSAGCATST